MRSFSFRKVAAAWAALLLAAGPSAIARAADGWPPPPGVVIDASPEPESSFVGSPSIAILPDGAYVASHDFFGTKSGRFATTIILRSEDRGRTWSKLAKLDHQFWSSLFFHHGALYLLGTAGEYDNIVIRRSRDGGSTWTEPMDSSSGLLFAGRFHCAPTPVMMHGGRLWRAFEHYTGTGSWSGSFFSSCVISMDAAADPLRASSWIRSSEISFDPKWLNADHPGWLEGNVVVAPDGSLKNMLRLHEPPTFQDRFELDGGAAGIPRYEAAALIDVNPDGKSIRFDPGHGFIHFPGAGSKFTIRFDPVSRKYWSVVNKITNAYSGYSADYLPYHQRNVLELTCSSDLRTWDEKYRLLRWRDGLPIEQTARVGFQYADWQFDGQDLIAVVRTSWHGNTYHNANFLTFHRLANFRSLAMKDSPPQLETPDVVR